MRLNEFYKTSKEVRKSIVEEVDFQKIYKGDKKILVPNNMVVGNRLDNFKQLALLSSLEGESYDSEALGSLLGYTESSEITHNGINIEDLIGRLSGECSTIMPTVILGKFNYVVFSQNLLKSLRKKNALVVYPLGGLEFFCTNDTLAFLSTYTKLMKELQISSNLEADG